VRIGLSASEPSFFRGPVRHLLCSEVNYSRVETIGGKGDDCEAAMNALMRLLAVIALGVIGGLVVYLAGAHIDRLLHPECNLCRLAGLSLFTTFLIVFGALVFIWPTPGQRDSFPRR
jgi:hypothetical protein